MTADSLEQSLTKDEVHRRLLGDFQGAYSLGIGDSPEQGAGPVLVLRVATDDVSQFPIQVEIDGQAVPVVVRPGFRPPVPLRGAVSHPS